MWLLEKNKKENEMKWKIQKKKCFSFTSWSTVSKLTESFNGVVVVVAAASRWLRYAANNMLFCCSCITRAKNNRLISWADGIDDNECDLQITICIKNNNKSDNDCDRIKNEK